MSVDKQGKRTSLWENIGFGLICVLAIGSLATIVIAYCVSPLPR